MHSNCIFFSFLALLSHKLDPEAALPRKSPSSVTGRRRFRTEAVDLQGRSKARKLRAARRRAGYTVSDGLRREEVAGGRGEGG